MLVNPYLQWHTFGLKPGKRDDSKSCHGLSLSVPRAARLGGPETRESECLHIQQAPETKVDADTPRDNPIQCLLTKSSVCRSKKPRLRLGSNSKLGADPYSTIQSSMPVDLIGRFCCSGQSSMFQYPSQSPRSWRSQPMRASVFLTKFLVLWDVDGQEVISVWRKRLASKLLATALLPGT